MTHDPDANVTMPGGDIPPLTGRGGEVGALTAGDPVKRNHNGPRSLPNDREKARELAQGIVDSMCLTWRHDYGLIERREAAALRNSMSQIAEHEVRSVIERAIREERERCVAEADQFLKDIQISVEGRSRFTIGDLNREARKSVRYVRDRISGDYEKNWSSVPRSGEHKSEGR